MKRRNSCRISVAVKFHIVLIIAAAPAFPKSSYLSNVNATCGTTYRCGLCHVNENGGGARNQAGQAFQAGGYDPGYFCPAGISYLPSAGRSAHDALRIENNALLVTTGRPRTAVVSFFTPTGRNIARHVIRAPAAGTYALPLPAGVAGNGVVIMHSNLDASGRCVVRMVK